MAIKVLLVDDHELVRTGIRRLLDDFDDIEVIAEAESGEIAITLVREHRPQVVLMDVNMPGIGGLEVLERLKREQHKPRILVLSMHDEEYYAIRSPF